MTDTFHEPPVQSQPAAQPSMNTLFIPPPSKGPQGPGQFSTGLFDCSAGPFCLSYCCPCIVFGQNRQRYDALASGTPIKPEQVEPLSTNTLVFLGVHCLTGLSVVLEFFQRGAIRNRYGIAGSEGEDALISCCCMPCSQQQQSRELAHEESGAFPNGGPSHVSGDHKSQI